ncbi:MAG: hypothetical protein EH225_00245, partial [Calditrichaeota bacterium]
MMRAEHLKSNFICLLRIFSVFTITALLGCASSGINNIKNWYEDGEYQQVVNSDIECEDVSESCFELNFLKSESFYHLEQAEDAWRYANRAIDSYSPDVGLTSLNRFLVFRGNLAIQLIRDLQEWENQTSLLRRVENEMQKGIQRNIEQGRLGQDSEEFNRLLIVYADILLEKMELYSDRNLDIQFDRLQETVNMFGSSLEEAGLDDYYLLEGELKNIMPQVRSWTYQGQSLGEKDRLLAQL